MHDHTTSRHQRRRLLQFAEVAYFATLTTSGLSSRKHSKAKRVLIAQLTKHCCAALKLSLSAAMVINKAGSS